MFGDRTIRSDMWWPTVRFAAAALCCYGGSTAGEFSVRQDGNSHRIFLGNQPILQYQLKAKPFKPYLKELYSQSGVQILRDSPADHIHHHALMYAIAVDGIDFWAEAPETKPGKQVPRDVHQERPSKSADGVKQPDTISQIIDWIGPDEIPVLQEERVISVDPWTEDNVTLVTWTVILRPAERRESATLSGRPYFGLGMRFVESMDKGGTFFNSDNAAPIPMGDTLQHTQAKWCAYTASVEAKPVTVAMFDSPENPQPVTWFTMTNPFAYISATVVRDDNPVVLKSGESLRLTYGVAVWDGTVGPEMINRCYADWRKP